MMAVATRPGHLVRIIWSNNRLLAVTLNDQGDVCDVTEDIARLIHDHGIEFERRDWGIEAREGSA